jgi:hypothetical protein
VRLLPPATEEFYGVVRQFFSIRFAPNNILRLRQKSFAAFGGEILSLRGCVKSLFMALRAKFKFETDVFFMILRSKIMKNTSVLKEYSAAEGGKNLFTQPLKMIIWREAPKKYFSHNPCGRMRCARTRTPHTPTRGDIPCLFLAAFFFFLRFSSIAVRLNGAESF